MMQFNSRTFNDAFVMAKRLLILRLRIPQVTNLARFAWHNFLLGTRTQKIYAYKPVSVGVYINQKCNLKCPFCYLNWDDVDEIPRDDMTLEDFEGILSHPLCKNAVRCFVGGGEPLLHKKYFEFVRIAEEHHMFTATHTNGLLNHAKLDDLVRGGPDSLNISLYDEHMDKQISQAKDLAKAYRNNCVHRKITFCRIVNRENYKEMGKFIELTLEAGISSMFFQNYYPASWPSGNVDHEAFHLPIWEEHKEALAHIDLLKKKYEKKLRIQWPTILHKKTSQGDSCISLMGVINFDKNGSVSPCCYIAPPLEKYGNLKDEDVWNNKYYTAIRRMLHDPKVPLNDACEQCGIRGGSLVKIY